MTKNHYKLKLRIFKILVKIQFKISEKIEFSNSILKIKIYHIQSISQNLNKKAS